MAMAWTNAFNNFVTDPIAFVVNILNLGPQIRKDTTKEIGHATSDDLRTLKRDPTNPVLEVGDGWNSNDVEDPSLLEVDGRYHMFFSGNDSEHKQIGHATSDDLRDWEDDRSNPVIEVGDADDWDSLSVDNPFVLEYDGEFHMFFNGNDGSGRRVGHATSDDLRDWRKDSDNPVIELADAGAWDSTNVAEPSVVEWGGRFYLYYGGHDGDEWRIGCATSDDLSSWQRHPANPLITTGTVDEWDAHVVEGPSVAVENDRLEMVYSGGHRRGRSGPIPKHVGRATATDPVDWEKYPENPVLRTGSEPGWEVERIGNPHLFVDSTGYHLFYTGWTNQ